MAFRPRILYAQERPQNHRIASGSMLFLVVGILPALYLEIRQKLVSMGAAPRSGAGHEWDVCVVHPIFVSGVSPLCNPRDKITKPGNARAISMVGCQPLRPFAINPVMEIREFPLGWIIHLEESFVPEG
jgi:hypothetical protein